MGFFSKIKSKVKSVAKSIKRKVTTSVKKATSTVKKVSRTIKRVATAPSRAVKAAVTKSVSRTIKRAKNVFSSVDKAVGGFLPGGITPTESKTARSIKRTSQLSDLTDAQELQFIEELRNRRLKEGFDQAADIVSERGLEQFGLFLSDEEKAFREVQVQNALREQFIAESERTENSLKGFDALSDEFKAEVDSAFDATKKTNIGTTILIGVAILGVAFVAGKSL